MGDALLDGFACCPNCRRIFDNSLQNRLLSASWLIRKHNYHNMDQLISATKISENEAIFVYSFVEENCYSHEEFCKALEELGLIRENGKKAG